MGLLSELRRRNVSRAAIAYVIIAWIILQVGVTLAPALRLEEWVNTALAFFLILGFPIALFLAWVYDLTPEGIKLEKHVDRSLSITHISGRKLDYFIIAGLVLALSLLAFDKWVLDPSRDARLLRAMEDAVTEQPAESDATEIVDNSIAVLAEPNRHPTDNLVAYDAYLLGRQKMARRKSNALQEAVGHFSEAIRLDPEYALAYVGLADAYALLGHYGALDDQAVVAQAGPAVERALELNDRLGEAYASLGAVRFRQQDYAGAERAYKTALRLSPNYAPAYHGYGRLLNWGFGRTQEGLALNQTALGLDPLSTPINMAVVEGYHELGRFEDALALCQRIIEIDPDYPRGYTIMADLYWEVFARLDEGIRWLHRAVELDPGNPDHARWLGMVYLDLGDLMAGEYWMREAMRLAPTQHDSMWAAVHLVRYTSSSEEIITAARELLELLPNNLLSLKLLRDADYRAGRGDAALQRFRAAEPDLVDGEDPEVDATNWGFAIEIANILTTLGERQ